MMILACDSFMQLDELQRWGSDTVEMFQVPGVKLGKLFGILWSGSLSVILGLLPLLIERDGKVLLITKSDISVTIFFFLQVTVVSKNVKKKIWILGIRK